MVSKTIGGLSSSLSVEDNMRYCNGALKLEVHVRGQCEHKEWIISGGSRGVSLVSTETPFQIGINKIIYNHALINYSY